MIDQLAAMLSIRGQEIARLANRVHRQRIRIRELQSFIRARVPELEKENRRLLNQLSGTTEQLQRSQEHHRKVIRGILDDKRQPGKDYVVAENTLYDDWELTLITLERLARGTGDDDPDELKYLMYRDLKVYAQRTGKL